MAKIDDKDRYGEEITLPKGIVFFKHLEEKDIGHKYSSGKYDITIVYPKDSKGIKKIQGICSAFAKELLGNDNGMQAITDGDKKKQDCFKNKWTCKPKCKAKPEVEDENGDYLKEADIKAGMQVRANVTPYAYGDGDGGVTGVSFILKSVRVYLNGDTEEVDVVGGGRKSATASFDKADEIDE